MMRGCLVVLAGACSSALAQFGTAVWQVSADDGATWVSALELSTPQSVLVRMQMGWSLIPNAVGFGGAQFDAIVEGAAQGDSVRNITRPRTFSSFAQTLAASRYSRGIKIDTVADTAEPGGGSGWINPAEGIPSTLTDFNTSNPAVVFTYTLDVSAEAGTRTIYNIFNNVPNRAMAIYINADGESVRMSAGLIEISIATVTVIPAPSAAGCVLGLSAAWMRRNRR